MASPEDETDRPVEVPDPLNADPAVALEREVYWAAPAGARSSQALASSTPASEIAIVWSEMEDRLRYDRRQAPPPDEVAVEATGRVRRALRSAVFRIFRPLIRRHDRLLARAARLGADTARSLADTQLELARLREQVQTMTPGGSEPAAWAAGEGVPPAPPALPEALTRRLASLLREDAAAEASRMRSREGLAASIHQHAGGSPVWLQAGCGQGELAARLLAAGWRVSASDPSPDAVAAVRARGVDARIGDAPAFLDAYDGDPPTVVHLVRALEPLTPPAWLDLLRRSAEVLAPGGTLLVEGFDPRSPSSMAWFYAGIIHRWPVHPEVLRAFVEHVGLHDVEVSGLGPGEGADQAYLLVARKP